MNFMKLLGYELDKLLRKRMMIPLILLVLVLNWGFGVQSITREDDQGISLKAVSAFYRDHQGEDGTEILASIETTLEDALTPVYTQSAASEYALYTQQKEEIREILEYSDYLEQVRGQAEQLMKTKLLAKPGTYSYRLAERTLTAYQGLDEVSLTVQDSGAVQLLTENQTTLLLLMVVVLSLVPEIFLTESEEGQLRLLRTTRYGKNHLLAAKVLAVVTSLLFLLLLLWGENLLLCQVEGLELGDLQRGIQSVSGYLACACRLTVGEYLLRIFLLNYATLLAIALLLAMGCILLQNSVLVYLFAAAISLGEIGCYITIGIHGTWAVFRQINLVTLFSLPEVLQEFQCVNLLSHPVGTVFALEVMLLLILIFCGGVVGLCWRKPEWMLQHPVLNRKHRRKPSKQRKIPAFSFSLFWQESGKLLRENKGGIVLLLLLALQIVSYRGTVTQNGLDEFYYQKYAAQLEGAITEEKRTYVEEMRNHFDDVSQQIEAYNQAIADGTIGASYGMYQLESLHTEMEEYSGFVRAEEQFQFLCQQADEGYQVVFLSDTGYRQLLGQVSDDILDGAKLCFVLILVLSNVFAGEFQNNIHLVYAAAPRGYRKVLRSKWWVTGIFTILSVAIAWIPRLIQMMRSFPLTGWSAGARSLMMFSGAPEGFSILGWYLIVMLVRLLAALAAAALILGISWKSRRQLVTILISLILLELPVLASSLGLLGAGGWTSVITGQIVIWT